MSNSLYNLTISNNNEINNLKKYISNISNNINNLKYQLSEMEKNINIELYIQLIGSIANIVSYIKIILDKKNITDTVIKVYDLNLNEVSFIVLSEISTDSNLLKQKIHLATGIDVYTLFFGNSNINTDDYIFTLLNSPFGELYASIKYTEPYECRILSNSFTLISIIGDQNFFSTFNFPNATELELIPENINKLNFNKKSASTGGGLFYKNDILYYAIQDIFGRNYEKGLYKLNTLTNISSKILDIHCYATFKYPYDSNKLIYGEFYDIISGNVPGVEIDYKGRYWILDENNIENKELLIDTDTYGNKLSRLSQIFIKDDDMYFINNLALTNPDRQVNYQSALIKINLKTKQKTLVWKSDIKEISISSIFIYDDIIYLASLIRGMNIFKLTKNDNDNYELNKNIMIGGENDINGDLQSWFFADKTYTYNNKEYLILGAKLAILFIEIGTDNVYTTNSLYSPLVNASAIGTPTINNGKIRYAAINQKYFF